MSVSDNSASFSWVGGRADLGRIKEFCSDQEICYGNYCKIIAEKRVIRKQICFAWRPCEAYLMGWVLLWFFVAFGWGFFSIRCSLQRKEKENNASSLIWKHEVQSLRYCKPNCVVVFHSLSNNSHKNSEKILSILLEISNSFILGLRCLKGTSRSK